MNSMKTALVLEGGGMKGIYTAGVLDVFMDRNVKVDAIIGVSAGALFGVNFLSNQRGRTIRYNKKYNKTWNYMGIMTLLTTGNIINTKLAYEKVPREYDIFDNETYMKSGIPFYSVVTNIRTGKPEYYEMVDLFEQMDTLRASASMPFVSTPVKIGDDYYLDGAITDSIPYAKMLEMGYDRLIVIRTKCEGYRKKPIPKLLSDIYYRKKYPELAKAIDNRHNMYNAQLDGLEELKKEGKAIVLCPSRNIKISKIEKNPEALQRMYDLGVEDGKKLKLY